MAAILLGLTLPITPVQILWVNMVTAVTLGLALAFEPAEPDVMRRPPRAPDEPLLSGFLAWRVGPGLGRSSWPAPSACSPGRRGAGWRSRRRARSAVNTLVAMQVVYLFSVRYLRLTSLTWTGVLGTPAVLAGRRRGRGAPARLHLRAADAGAVRHAAGRRSATGWRSWRRGPRCSRCWRSRSSPAAASGWTARDGARPGTRSPRADGRAPRRKGGGGRPGAPHPGGPRRGGRRSSSSQSRSRP